MPAQLSPPFECQILPGKGTGVIATSFIPAKTPLITAPPLLLVVSSADATPDLITAAFKALPTKLSSAYLALFSAPELLDPVLGVWKANNFCLDSRGIVNGVFDVPSRFNHSCLGGDNARWEWDEEDELISFYADCDIEEGEEICVCYRPGWSMDKASRRVKLETEYGFYCQCTVCEDPTEE